MERKISTSDWYSAGLFLHYSLLPDRHTARTCRMLEKYAAARKGVSSGIKRRTEGRHKSTKAKLGTDVAFRYSCRAIKDERRAISSTQLSNRHARNIAKSSPDRRIDANRLGSFRWISSIPRLKAFCSCLGFWRARKGFCFSGDEIGSIRWHVVGHRRTRFRNGMFYQCE